MYQNHVTNFVQILSQQPPKLVLVYALYFSWFTVYYLRLADKIHEERLIYFPNFNFCAIVLYRDVSLPAK